MSRPTPQPESPLLRAALALAERGFAVFPLFEPVAGGDCSCQPSSRTRDAQGRCGNAGKHPRTTSGVKAATTDPQQVRRWWWQAPTASVALATGRALPDGRVLLVLDVDPRNQGDDSLRALEQEHGALPDTVRALTGGGGLHIFLAAASALRGTVLAPGVDVKGEGGYVVAPPSAHASGRIYAWDAEQHPDETPIADVPAWVLARLQARRVYPASTSAVADGVVGRAFDLAGWLGQGVGPDRTAARCPWASQHTTGAEFDGSTVIFAPAPGHTRGWFWCSHEHCRGRSQAEALAALPQAAVAAAEQQAATPPADESVPGLKVNTRGLPTKDPGNAVLILRHDREWRGVLGYNIFSHRPIWRAAAPALVGFDAPGPGPYRNRDWLYLQHWLLLHGGQSFGKDTVHEAARAAATEFHPVRDYLTGLEWDGTPRLDIWLPQYLGTPAGRYAAFIGARFLIAAVARILRPGCQADQMLILEGPQGLGKSQAVRILASPEWHLGDLPDLRSKDALQLVAGKWIIEVGELDAFKGAASTRVKSFLTQIIDTFRTPWDRHPEDHPRQCVFIGTTNEDHYLRDATGARRFWPIRCGTFDHAALARDRDALWAEAVHRFHVGEHWWPETAEHHALLAEATEQRFDLDEWEPLLAEYLLGRTGVAMGDCLGAVGLEKARWGMIEQKRVGAVLKRLGFTRTIGRVDGAVTRHWRRV